MINENTKNIKGGKAYQQQSPYAKGGSPETAVCVTPTSAKESAVSNAVHVAGLLRQEPQRSNSRDSLRSLQQLVDRGEEDTDSCGKPYINEDSSSYGMSVPLKNARSDSCTTTTNYLRPRMQFTGYQISGYKKYQVVINLKTVGLPISGATSPSPHVTGFLTIL